MQEEIYELQLEEGQSIICEFKQGTIRLKRFYNKIKLNHTRILLLVILVSHFKILTLLLVNFLT